MNLYSDSHGKSSTILTNITSLLFVYAVFSPILHILVIHCQDDVCSEQFCCYRLDGFIKSFIIVNTHRRRYVASGTGFKQDSPNPNSFNRISSE